MWSPASVSITDGCRAWRCVWWLKMDCRIARPVGISGVTTASLSPSPRSRIGSRPGGKRAAEQLDTAYLDWALADFSGYIAADELYDGPFCILSIVDNHTFKRLICQVLDHDPTQADIDAFFQRFQAQLTARKLRLRGITTDASPLYPTPSPRCLAPCPIKSVNFTCWRT
jgi:hypothetical protein